MVVVIGRGSPPIVANGTPTQSEANEAATLLREWILGVSREGEGLTAETQELELKISAEFSSDPRAGHTTHAFRA